MVTVDPRTVIVRPAMAVDPVAEGVPLTEDVELINVDVRLKIESNEMARLLRVAVAVPRIAACRIGQQTRRQPTGDASKRIPHRLALRPPCYVAPVGALNAMAIWPLPIYLGLVAYFNNTTC
jgi:hypothetical protein